MLAIDPLRPPEMTMRARTGIPADVVRAQLQRIMTSRAFDASEPNRRLLEFVVDEVLGESATSITEQSIARSIFGRDASFDPQADPIVRVEIDRLRQSLDRYYRRPARAS